MIERVARATEEEARDFPYVLPTCWRKEMLSKPTLYDKYHAFLEQQTSFQRWRAIENGNQGKSTESQHCTLRANTFEELLNDLQQLQTEATPAREDRFSTNPANETLILDLLKDNDGERTIKQIAQYAYDIGRNPKSMQQMALRMVRLGKLSRTGDLLELVE